jgi:hypothetical protein
MTPTTLVEPELEEAIDVRKEREPMLPRNGSGGSQSTLPVSADSELKKLDEGQLKAAIKSNWKKHERLAKKEMGPLLYWLREKLRAAGSRNDLRDRDNGFGAWVEENLDVVRRTADRWADEHGLANGLMERKSTFGQMSKGSGENTEESNPALQHFANELEQSGCMIQFKLWLKRKDHKEYQQALKIIQKHFKLENENLAVWKGVLYAADRIISTGTTRNMQSGAIATTARTQEVRLRTANKSSKGTHGNAILARELSPTTRAANRRDMQSTSGHRRRKSTATNRRVA